MPALPEQLQQGVNEAKVFVVGAGGIGCELLKNLVLTGFRNIQVIDLDTIDVSNLNRQFLFQKKHVGKPKALIAKESVLRLCPTANIKSIHDSIFNPDYNMEFFKQFDLVLNALDNRAARNHVNRMCLAADVPLVESGSAGYLGQVTVIKKGLTECYECKPAPRQKTFPGCTIRNTPSELIHCIVWAKYLFNQLFGEEDADQDVSPDTEDPEAKHSGDDINRPSENSNVSSLMQRKSTRDWCRECDYNAAMIFNKLFDSDIRYLLSMDKLWQKRKPPVPMAWESTEADSDPRHNAANSDFQALLSVKENALLFASSISKLKAQFKKEGDGGMLVWDKDDEPAMSFVSSAANIRANIFSINEASQFEVKSMAGNIIPAIATTNAIVAGLIVMQALCIVQKEIGKCRSVFVCKQVSTTKKLLKPEMLDPPKPDCYVCSEKPEITIKLDTTKLTVFELQEKILKSNLGMLAPDVEILDGRATILISSDEEDMDEDNLNRPLSDFNIRHGSRLRADDFLQNYDIVVNILHGTDMKDDNTLFEVVTKTGEIFAKQDMKEIKSAKEQEPSTSAAAYESEDDIVIMDDAVESNATILPPKKRKHDSNGEIKEVNNNTKRRKTNVENGSKQSTTTDVFIIE